MDLRQTILSGHNKAICHKVVDYVGINPKRFEALLEVFLGGPYRVTQRAAWPLSQCVERDPDLILPHINRVLTFAGNAGVHDSVKRNTMRLLQFVNVPTKSKGKALQLAFCFLQNRKEAVAIRVFSLTVIANLINDKPELKRELTLIIEDEMPYATAAFRSRALKVLKQLSRDSKTL
jgi:hypothetical protein